MAAKAKDNPYPIVLVVWLDHAGDKSPATWRSFEEISGDRALEVWSIGWKVHEDETVLLIAAAVDLTDRVGASVQTIIKRDILKIHSVRVETSGRKESR